MGLMFARRGEWRRHPPWVACFGTTLLLALLVGCGGSDGSNPAGAPSGLVSPAGSVRPGELPPELLLGEPRNEDHTSRIALAWSSEGAFTGSILARIEFGLDLTPLDQFTLQHNGAPAVYQAAGDEGAVPFELRYVDGFFLLTARADNPSGLQGLFGVDVFATGAPPVPPAGIPPCRGNDTEVCSNSLGFIPNSDWPKVAGDWRSLWIARADPAMLTYDVFVKTNARAEFFGTLLGVTGQGDPRMPRGTASTWDFPTARVKVRGCNGAGECVESAERSLQSALVRGIVPIDATGPAPNGRVTLGGDRMALLEQPISAGSLPFVRILQREPEQGRWRNRAQIQNAAPGFGRSLALSPDGDTLAVEASPCAVSTVVCHASSVFVYTADLTGSTWTQRARLDGVRLPKLVSRGDRLVGLGVGPTRANTVVTFELRASWVEVPPLVLDYAPLDIAMASHAVTIAVARQGTLTDPCGCRAVVIYDWEFQTATPGWRRLAVLHSKKRLDTVGSPNDDGFGYASGSTQSIAVSQDGSLVAVGASLDSSDASDRVGDPANHNAPRSGAVYVFQRQSNGTFVQQAYIKAAGAAPLDHFGHSVALAGSRLYAGARGLTANAPGVNRNHAPDPALPSPTPGADGSLTGAGAYAFEPIDGAWVELAKMIAPNADTADFSTFHSISAMPDGTVALTTGMRDAADAVSRRVFVY